MVKSMLFCKGRGTGCFGGSDEFLSTFGWDVVEPKRLFPKAEIRLFANPEPLEFTGEFSFF